MNLDPRSFYYNGECGVFIEDPEFAARLYTKGRDYAFRILSARNEHFGEAWRKFRKLRKVLPQFEKDDVNRMHGKPLDEDEAENALKELDEMFKNQQAAQEAQEAQEKAEAEPPAG